MSVRYLTTEDVEQLHERIIREFGGASIALRDFGALESAVKTPEQNVFDTELYPTIGDKAAILLFLLIENHPFVDGNKRTAVAALELFLESTGLNLTSTSEDEVFDIAIAIATGAMKKEEIVAWLEPRITP